MDTGNNGKTGHAGRGGLAFPSSLSVSLGNKRKRYTEAGWVKMSGGGGFPYVAWSKEEREKEGYQICNVDNTSPWKRRYQVTPDVSLLVCRGGR